MSFPLSTSVRVDGLAGRACGNDYVCNKFAEIHIKTFIDSNSDLYVSTSEAENYARKMMFGHDPSFRVFPVRQKVLAAIKQLFFSGSSFDGKHSTISPLQLKAADVKFSDGDTLSAHVNSKKIRFRLAGIDTPESFLGTESGGKFRPNPKLDILIDAVWLNWVIENGLSGRDERTTKLMIRNRIVYTGLLAGAVSKGVVSWATENNIPIAIYPSFDRTSTEPAMCNTIAITDTYERMLGVPKIGTPGEQKNLTGLFIKFVLPKIMSSEGMDYYNYFHHKQSPAGKNWKRDIGALTEEGKALLNEWQNVPAKQIIWEALVPETLALPSEIFSKNNCEKLAAEWFAFTKIHPDYKNDLQAMLVFIGLAFAYPKYRTAHTSALLEAEKVAKFGQTVNGTNVHGLWKDPLFKIIQPNPDFSAVYKNFGHDISRGKPLTPPDCCDILKSSGKDVFDHCQ